MKPTRYTKLALIVLIMVVGLSGCASYGVNSVVLSDFAYYAKNPGGYWDWETLKDEFAHYGKNPGGYWDWETLKDEYAHYGKNPGGYWDWETLKRDWAEFVNLPAHDAGGKSPHEEQSPSLVP